jgi:hypothetical protein
MRGEWHTGEGNECMSGKVAKGSCLEEGVRENITVIREKDDTH